jgi:hypothetical protein
VNQSGKTVYILILVVAALAGMMILAGCSDDDDPVVVPDPDPPIGPASLHELMSQFVTAYENMDLDNYLALLDPEFLMILGDETIIDFPDVGTTLDITKEERIHQRMFSGEQLTDPDGNFLPGTSAIVFQVFMALAEWVPSDDEDQFPGTVWAPFELDLLFDRGQSFSTLKVEGTVKIYARAHEAEVDGTTIAYYLMAGMVDLTGYGKGTESGSWGSVKALYR